VNSRKNMVICKNERLARTSDNRAYLATVLLTFAPIPLRWTSDTLGTLSAMLCLKDTTVVTVNKKEVIQNAKTVY